MRALSRVAAIIGILAIALFWLLPGAANADPQQALPAANAAQPIDKTAWATKLVALKDADWRYASRVGDELAELPPDEGYEILKENWEQIEKIEARQQILKSWKVAMPYPLHARNHPHLLDVLDLGMRDRSPEVQKWALNSLRGVAFQDFAEDFAAYKTWFAAARGRPVAEVICESVRQFVIELAKAEGKEAEQRAELMKREMTFRDVPESRQAALEAGILKIIERWIAASIAPKADRASMKLASYGLGMLTQLQVGEDDVRRIAVPLLEKSVPSEVRSAAVGSMGRKEFRWAVDLVIDALKVSASEGGREIRTDLWGIANTLADLDNPKAIPVMIAVIDADNTYDTVYGVGYFGLGRLTGVNYDEAHDGAWWRKWWVNNREKYPEDVRKLAIPEFPKQTGARASKANTADGTDALADVDDVPAQDLRVEGDDKKRYFLIGKVEQLDSAADAAGLVVVLPGGDGSADFHPFIRRISKNVLPTGWLIAQAVAPQWDKKQSGQVVWPTEKLSYPAAKFTTEEFIEGIIADVRAKAKVDSRRIFLLGWSSGGPACYAAALRKETPVTGAFIAMSIFRPQLVPAIENARGRAFYLLQSPDDGVTPIRFAVDAEKTLGAVGANVQLKQYKGGHGWQGNVWAMIGDGIQWLEKPASVVASEADPTDKTAANILLNPSFEDGDKSPAQWSPGAELDGVEYAWDKTVAHKGKASLCLNKTAKRYFPIAQWLQIVERKTDRPSLQVSAQVKAEGVTKAIIDVIFLDEDEKSISHEWVAYIGAKDAKAPPVDHDWKEYLGKVKIPERTRKLQISLQIYGPGKVWFDEIRAEYVP